MHLIFPGSTVLPHRVCDLHTAPLYESIHIRFHFLLHRLPWIRFWTAAFVGQKMYDCIPNGFAHQRHTRFSLSKRTEVRSKQSPRLSKYLWQLNFVLLDLLEDHPTLWIGVPFIELLILNKCITLPTNSQSLVKVHRTTEFWLEPTLRITCCGLAAPCYHTQSKQAFTHSPLFSSYSFQLFSMQRQSGSAKPKHKQSL